LYGSYPKLIIAGRYFTYTTVPQHEEPYVKEMSMRDVSVKWVASKLMVGVDSFGHPIVLSSWPERDPEWAGVRPADLLLLSAASCSAYDVASILLKQKQPMQSLEVSCQGEQKPDPPRAFTHIHLHYAVAGAVDAAKVEKAIQLSLDKYCSVVNTLKPAVDITSDYSVEDV
jgi:putative redox protein